MIEPFLLNALLGGTGMALMCGPLGCFIAWLRLAYFGDAIGHAALLGVALALMFHVHFTLGILAAALLMATLLTLLQRDTRLASDTLLGVLAHGALALGLVLVALMHYPLDVQAFLFGDILTMTPSDILLMFVAAFIVIGLLALEWRSLMLMVLSRDIASVEGVRVERLRAMLMLLIALAVAVSIKVVGMLLITSMLIVPAATARHFARTPHGMAGLSMLAGVVAVAGGLYASYRMDTPSGPSIILAAIVLFLIARVAAMLRSAPSPARGPKL